MLVRFTRSEHNVSFEQITEAANHIGLRNATITLENGPKSRFWIVEADEELEVLMDVVSEASASEAEVPVG